MVAHSCRLSEAVDTARSGTERCATLRGTVPKCPVRRNLHTACPLPPRRGHYQLSYNRPRHGGGGELAV